MIDNDISNPMIGCKTNLNISIMPKPSNIAAKAIKICSTWN